MCQFMMRLNYNYTILYFSYIRVIYCFLIDNKTRSLKNALNHSWAGHVGSSFVLLLHHEVVPIVLATPVSPAGIPQSDSQTFSTLTDLLADFIQRSLNPKCFILPLQGEGERWSMPETKRFSVSVS